MNEVIIFEELRPETRPLTAEQVDALRAHVFDGAPLVDHGTDGDGARMEQLGDVHDLALSEVAVERRARTSWFVGIAAAAVVAVGVSGLWTLSRSNSDDPPGPAEQPVSTAPSPTAPVAATPIWYSTIRPFLPDGMDQIALTQASPEVVAFKAFRTGTRQVLDVTIVLEPGLDAKDTGESPTFTDEAGDYFESTSGLGLITPDRRTITLSCGLSPLSGGAVGSVGMASSQRDYCRDGFDNAGLDAQARRALAARLATEFPADAVTPAFGQPEQPSVEPARTLDAVRAFVADGRAPIAAEQWGGVVRVINLSENPDGLTTTELTIVHGVWPPRGADVSPANSLEQPDPPRGRFYDYGDLGTAFVVGDDGTGYSIVTSDMDQEHWDRLGLLLQQLVEPPPATEPAAIDQPDQTEHATPTTTPQVLIEPGTVVCVDAGAGRRAVELCQDELGGTPAAGAWSDDSYVMPVDAGDPAAISATGAVAGALGATTRTRDPALLLNATPPPSQATTYYVLGARNPYTAAATCAAGASSTVPNVTGLPYIDAVDALVTSGLIPDPIRELVPDGTVVTAADYAVIRQGAEPGVTTACGAAVQLAIAFRHGELYVVQDGDTWDSIARDQGLELDELLAFNGLSAAELGTTAGPSAGDAIVVSPRADGVGPNIRDGSP